MTFRTYYNSKTIVNTERIIDAEELNLKVTIKDDALGDTIIEVKGDKEEVKIFKQIFEMIK